MKIAVSLPDELFTRADEMASRLGLNRSQLYAAAVERFLQEHGEDPVTRKLDEISAEFDGEAGRSAGRRLIEAGAWEW